jgi:cysteine desulfurase family protein
MSWPKPPAVIDAMRRALDDAGGNPGRSSHRLAMRASEIVYECREKLAQLFHIGDPLRIAFTANATAALNLALKGTLKPGDHAVFSSMEHNAVWRPLARLRERGVRLSMAAAGADGVVSAESVERAMERDTRLIALVHASNVNGAINPVAEIGRIAQQRGAMLLVDAAQTAGAVPIDVAAMHIDLLAFPGHKGLLGPAGTGGLYVRDPIRLETLVEGGTGSDSASELQPSYMPDRYESGTLNTSGIAGLNAAVGYVLDRGVAAIESAERRLATILMDGLRSIPRIRLYGPDDAGAKTGVISFTMEGRDPVVLADELEREFDVASRAGLHCAPLAHRTQGTGASGAVRFSLGESSTEQDIHAALSAVRTLAQRT